MSEKTGIPNNNTVLESSGVLDESVSLLKKIMKASDKERDEILNSIEDKKLKILIETLLKQVSNVDNGKEKISKMLNDNAWISGIFSGQVDFKKYIKNLPEKVARLIIKTGILNFLNKLKPNSGDESSNAKVKSTAVSAK